MGVDLSEPNWLAFEKLGIFEKFDNGEIEGYPDKHPAGWTEAVIDRIESEANLVDGVTRSLFRDFEDLVNWDNYTAEEKAAFEWYWYEVLPEDKWPKIVDAYYADFEDDVTWDEFGEQDHLAVDGTVDVPEVKTYTGGDNKNGELKVSTEAIRYFANSIGKLFSTPGGEPDSLMLKVARDLDGLNVLPGKFARAEKMRRKLSGGDETPGLIRDSADLLVKIHQTLFTLRDSLLAMAKSYEYTEDGNLRTGKDLKDRSEAFRRLTEAEFAKAMKDPWGQIGDIDDYGQISTQGGGGGDKSGGDKDSGGGDKE